MGRQTTGKPRGRPPGLPAFARVARAREALANSAEEMVKLVKVAAKVAARKGNHAPAVWALEHIAAKDGEGKLVRPLESSVDRQVIDSGSRAPTINIGWIAAPGSAQAPALPIIDVKALPPHTEE